MANMEQVRLIAALKDKGLHEVADHMMHLFERQDDVDKKVEAIQRCMDDIKKAFPKEDPYGHRLYHEKVIRQREAMDEVRWSVKADLYQKAAWIVIGLIVAGIGLKFGIGL
jgi:hypothetical protein